VCLALLDPACQREGGNGKKGMGRAVEDKAGRMAEEHAHYTQTDTILHFGAYQLDLAGQQLWRGQEAVRLTGKAFAVLAYLVRQPGQLVSKDDLFHAVWPDTVVSDSALTTCIKELRKALQDRAKAPQYIETVHRRGFRFIAALRTPEANSSPDSQSLDEQPVCASTSPISSSVRRIVGREVDLGQLHAWLDKAQAGARQIVFITGEPVIGKTAIVETFLSQVAGQEAVQIGRGQCIEQHGAGEAYLPILEGVRASVFGPQADHMIVLLRHNAPTWLAQMLTVLPLEERELLQREVQGVARERMLRELAEALEVLTAETPLVLVLEDVHWSDASTLGLLALLARRPEAARLMVIGTYRPTEMLSNGHPLRGLVQELSVHRQCRELRLRRLGVEEAESYLRQRFPTSAFPIRLPQVLHERTGGNPLFLVTTVEDLIANDVLGETQATWSLRVPLADLSLNMPDSLRRLIAKQMERLERAEREVLAAGSIAVPSIIQFWVFG
jgi:DNA-binding winged helix-turn-helix (wHTH) protein